MSTPPFRHWYVRLEPLAVTEKVTDSPVHFVASEGPTEIDGGVLTVSVAGFDSKEPPEFVHTARYSLPLCDVVAVNESDELVSSTMFE